MELDVFAGGEVAAASRVFVRNVREDAKLRGLQHARGDLHAQHLESWLPLAVRAVLQAKGAELFGRDGAVLQLLRALFKADDFRSEEHTSELQSRSDLVCRLLLEKKKKRISISRSAIHPRSIRAIPAWPRCTLSE